MRRQQQRAVGTSHVAPVGSDAVFAAAVVVVAAAAAVQGPIPSLRVIAGAVQTAALPVAVAVSVERVFLSPF